MKFCAVVFLLIFSVVSFATEKSCTPTKKFTDFARDQKIFTSNNPKKSITQFSTENNITPECVRDMLSAMTNQFAVEWVNKSKALNCYDEKSKNCPEETKKEIFGNINLFEQWNQWLSSNQNPAPDFSLCAEQFSADSFVKLTSSLSPILSVLKKEERMKFVLDLQKLNCEEGENVSAADSPNLEYFKKLKEKGMSAPIEDFFKLWYPSKKGEREDDPYFFGCQDNPWEALTKKAPIDESKIVKEENPYSEDELQKLIDVRNKLESSFNNFMISVTSVNDVDTAELIEKKVLALTQAVDEVNDYIERKEEFKKGQTKPLEYLAEECKPDVFYSWGPETKLKSMQNQMKDGALWSESPNPYPSSSSPLFMSMSPVSTFAYGPIGVRIKIKKSTPYRFISEHVGFSGKNKELQVRPGSFQDFTTKDASIIESWSYGTPEQYDEMARELKRFYENKRAQRYQFFGKYDSANDKKGLEKLYEEVDGYSADEKILKQRLLTHIDMILKGEGKIHYQKGSCRNRDESFRTRKPTYFNPG